MFDFIIIVPIRDREEHKRLFLKDYYPILNDNFNNFKIVFVEQDFKNQYFNRGKILNIGMDLYKNKTKSFVTHDIDVFCPIEILKEYLNSESDYDVDRIYVPHDSSCGGICKFTHDSIFEVNGFPNYIWGWGIEDRALYYRYQMLSKKISDYKYGQYKNGSDFTRLNHKHNGSNTHPRNKKISDSENEIVNKSLEEQKRHIYSSGLNNLDYDIISRETIADNIEYIKVSIDDNSTKIAVITFFTPNYTIGFETLKINKSYCKKHNYDFYFFDSLEESLKHKHAAWHKLFYVNKILKEKDYGHVVWIDADAFFCNDNIRIEQFITCDKNFIVQRDPGYSLEAFNVDKIKINTGLFIFKNTDWSKNFLDFVIHNQEFSEWDTKHNWEQNAIRRCIEKNYMNTLDNIFIIKDTFFNNNTHNIDEFINNGGFVLHMTNFMGQYRESRESKLYKFLHRNEDEKNCEYVSIRGIAKNCDHFPNSIVSDTNNFDPNDYKCIKENDTVFVISSVLNRFVENVIPKLGNTKFKLVTGACVKGVPNEISSIHKKDYISILSKNVTQWFTQNFDGTIECVPIPLGIDYHTLQRGNHPWGQMAHAKEQEENLKSFQNFNFDEKKHKTVSTFHFQMFERHDRDRHVAIEHLKGVKFNDILRSPVKRNSLWKFIKDYKFIISPHGNGLDCHRTYESILLGSIPIVRSSTLDGLYKDMPVLILNKWSDLNEKLLNDYVYKGNLEKLKLNYWVNLIKNSKPS
jgi:hypothetical protein